MVFAGLCGADAGAAPPVVTNVRAAQRAGTELVDIYYDVAADVPPLTAAVQVSADGGATFAVNAVSLTGAVGGGLQPGSNRHVVWNAGADWNGQFSSQVRLNVIVSDSNSAPGMVQIPAGNFQMGDTLDGLSSALPVHTVYVSAFYMDRYEVTKAMWDDVLAWGMTHGYTDIPVGSGKAANHPVQTISWYSMVKWCNARSEKEGLAPVYFTNDAQTALYQTGNVNITPAQVKWSANGYRLPTEAEWEKAARGGTSGHRFPWSNVNTITHSQANYKSLASDSYDVSPTRGYHPTYAVGGFSYTNPVGSFVANGYALYDMAGNVWEWCWDGYDSGYYSSSPSTDPPGPPPASYRVMRGGSWIGEALYSRTAYRNPGLPGDASADIGLRCVRR